MHNVVRPTSGAVKVKFHVTSSSYDRRPKILCATDLSSRSERAVQRANMLARQVDGQLLLLHVVDERQSMSMIARCADRARAVLENQIRQLVRFDGPPAEISVRVGKPIQTVSRVANEWDADLVVLGGARTSVAASVFGTAAERVANSAMRPVLVVNCDPSRHYARIVLASHVSGEFARVARMTQDLGFLDGAWISVVHALKPQPQLMLSAAALSEDQISRYLQQRKQISSDEIVAQLETAGLDAARFTIVPQYQTPLGAIDAAVERSRAELLVVGLPRFPALSRALGCNVANRVLRKIACDVLIASDAAARRGRPLVAPERSELSFLTSAEESSEGSGAARDTATAYAGALSG